MSGTIRPPEALGYAATSSTPGPASLAEKPRSQGTTGAGLLTPASMPKLCPTCGERFPAEFRVCPHDASELIEPAAEADADDLVGTTLGETYVIVRVIGEGGMGRVYEARHARIRSKRFAVKMLHPEYARNAEALSRFQREAEAAASIQSPFVVDVYDVDRTADGRPFMVGELLEGVELAEHLGRVGKLPIGLGVRVARQVASALSAAHEQGVVHRDMKPENVFLTGDLNDPIAKVIDFGISKTADRQGTALTKTGMIMGTPSYMAPEQARGERVDHRVDVYAAGATLYAILTGKRPFDRSDPTATLTAVLIEDPPAPRSIEPTIPEGLELCIQRAMAKNPEERYQTMAELDAALAHFDPTVQAASAAHLVSASPEAPQALAVVGGEHVGLARPLVLLLSGLGVFWIAGSLVMALAALLRMLRDADQPIDLTGSESALLFLAVALALSTPVALAVRHVRLRVWGNSARAVDLAARLRRPVMVGLSAYGFAGLLVRIIEVVLLRRAAGIAWPAWDLLLALIGAVAAIGAVTLAPREKRRS